MIIWDFKFERTEDHFTMTTHASQQVKSFLIFVSFQTSNKTSEFFLYRIFCLEVNARLLELGLGEHDYIAFDEYYNEPIRRSFGNCDIYNTTITWLRKHDHMARYFPIFLVFGAKFQYFDNGE